MRPKFVIFPCVLFAIMLTVSPLWAKNKAELIDSFAQRKTAVRQLKDQGKIGETTAGYIEAVDATKVSAAEQQLITAEDADRQELYKIIAQEQKADEGVVAREAAQRHYSKAQSGDWFKTDKGEWRKVK